MRCFARLIRCAMVDSGTMYASAICRVVKPATARSVNAIADDGVNRHNNEVITMLVLGSELSHGARVALENERLRDELRVSEERYRALIESTDDVIFTLDRESNIRSINQYCQRMTGKASDEVIGKKITDIIQYKNPDTVFQIVDRVLRSSKTVAQEEQVTIDGHDYFLDTKYKPVSTGDEQSQSVLVIARDITEHKTIEATTSKFKMEISHAASDPAENRQDFDLDLRKGITRLPELHRLVILLRYSEDAATDERADTLNRPAGTIRRILSESYRLLRLHLEGGNDS